MGAIASVFKTLTNDEYASDGIVNFRRSICNGCEFRKGGFCGTAIVGEIIEHKGQKKRLCGCLTNEKSLLKNQSCSIKKW